MDKRTILAVVLSVVVMFVFSFFQSADKPDMPVKQAGGKQHTSTSVNQQADSIASKPPLNSTSKNALLVDVKEIVVETDLFKAVFSSRGAGLKSLMLKRYNEALAKTPKPVVLGENADPDILNFSTQASGFNLSSSANYSANASSISLSGTQIKTLVFNYVSNQGFTIRKIYTISGDSYGIKLETQVFNNTQTPLVGAIQHLMTYPQKVAGDDNRFENAGSYLFAKDSLEINKGSDLEKSAKQYDNNVSWAGFADKFFLNSLVAVNNSIASVDLKKNAAGFIESVISSPQLTVNPGQMANVENMVFVGPKDIDILKSQGHSLEQSLDLGWFSFLAKPLLYCLKFFYKYVGNYGIAVIIITVILKILFFPLTHKSYKSMKDLQKVQPMMAAIKEKYANDRDAMNKAVMELYREHKVNPMGGCLPMVVQIPVFFALYKALMSSIELRHAPFFLWINDLSGPDNLIGDLFGLPFVIGPLPVVMGVTMFIQQKLTPAAGDPMQQKMLLYLPVVFTVMFLNFPSGLVLYWLVNNVLTIGQQMYINKSDI